MHFLARKEGPISQLHIRHDRIGLETGRAATSPNVLNTPASI